MESELTVTSVYVASAVETFTGQTAKVRTDHNGRVTFIFPRTDAVDTAVARFRANDSIGVRAYTDAAEKNWRVVKLARIGGAR